MNRRLCVAGVAVLGVFSSVVAVAALVPSAGAAAPSAVTVTGGNPWGMVRAVPDGSAYICGTVDSAVTIGGVTATPTGTGWAPFAAHVGADGSALWVHVGVVVSGDSESYGCVVTPDGGLALMFYAATGDGIDGVISSCFGYCTVVVRYDAAGSVVWSATSSETGDYGSQPNGISMAGSDFVVCGYVNDGVSSFGSYSVDALATGFFTASLSSAGTWLGADSSGDGCGGPWSFTPGDDVGALIDAVLVPSTTTTTAPGTTTTTTVPVTTTTLPVVIGPPLNGSIASVIAVVIGLLVSILVVLAVRR